MKKKKNDRDAGQKTVRRMVPRIVPRMVPENLRAAPFSILQAGPRTKYGDTTSPHLEVSLAAEIGNMLHHLDFLRGLDHAALHHSIV